MNAANGRGAKSDTQWICFEHCNLQKIIHFGQFSHWGLSESTDQSTYRIYSIHCLKDLSLCLLFVSICILILMIASYTHIICYLDICVDVCLPTCTPIHQTSSKICSPSIRSYPSGMGAVQAKQPEGQSCQGSMPQSVRGIVEKWYQGNPVPSCFGPDIHLINLDILILQCFKMF